ncbi:MAG: hypothetical protein JO284_18685 [Planctomycetaceae bacterium]|nr:hypothetical protein [Planctomycetaceae bacterium]MBV8606519.1 hypothetical protein [Singulisphaera sp.]MBV8233907.1 hypothetical protein [Planctomycetaceae bacterium]MBV8270635.1 hypothetical protein [Planctomycetaceae bacterium]MBV8314167.1 hypothetical protein [Planctomycetaceae bacterium]
MNQTRSLYSIGHLSEKFGVPVHKLEFAIKSRKIEPCGWAGNSRIFDEEGAEKVGAALSQIAADPRSRRMPRGRAAR